MSADELAKILQQKLNKDELFQLKKQLLTIRGGVDLWGALVDLLDCENEVEDE